MNPPISIGIFEDQTFFAKGLVDFLEQPVNRINVSFIATSQIELGQKLSIGTPNILVMDVLAPDVSGLDLFTTVLKKYNDLKIIAYTSLRSAILVENLLNLGVRGYVNKNQDPTDLLQAIREVYQGLISVPDNYRHHVTDETKLVKQTFTSREIQIITLISKGETSANIAETLDVSLRTIENLKVKLFDKLGVKNAPELILAATQLGYLS